MSSSLRNAHISLSELTIPREWDVFTRMLIRELSGTSYEVAGIEEASGFARYAIAN